MISFGPRSTFGFFLTPMSAANGWGRDVFGLALAIEMLLWGAGQPFAGALADRFGAPWVLTARRAALYRRHRLDGLRHDAAGAAPVGRRADRLRPCRLLVHAGDRRLRQAHAGGVAHARRSAPAPRPARSANSCSRRSRWR